MSTLRALAHLEEQLGPARWHELIDSANTGKVKALCDELLIPTTMVVGGRTYDILSVEGNIGSGHELVCLAQELDAHLGREERMHLLDHQQEIPSLLGKIKIIFTDDTSADDAHGSITSIEWDKGCRQWTCFWCRLDSTIIYRGRNIRVLRRRS